LFDYSLFDAGLQRHFLLGRPLVLGELVVTA